MIFRITTYNFPWLRASAFHLCLHSALALQCTSLHGTSRVSCTCKCALTETMSSRFGGSEKDHSFLKIPKWQHELAWYYKRVKVVSYFLNNAAKTCLYGLKNSENIEIGYFFQSRTFFHLSSNLIFTHVASASLEGVC